MRYIFGLALTLLSVGVAEAREAEVSSWRNPRVDFATYKKDAVDCAQHGYWRDVSGDEPAKAFIRGFKTADDLLNKPTMGVTARTDSWEDNVRRTQPDRRKRQVHGIQVQDVERCLSARGYEPFTLTPAEISTLKKMRAGFDERKRYLYSISLRRD